VCSKPSRTVLLSAIESALERLTTYQDLIQLSIVNLALLNEEYPGGEDAVQDKVCYHRMPGVTL
jgi:hypothetical protein